MRKCLAKHWSDETGNGGRVSRVNFFGPKLLRRQPAALVAVLFLAFSLQLLNGIDIVRDGKSSATIVVQGVASAPAGRRNGRQAETTGDAQAARVLAEWIRKMTGAELPIAVSAPSNEPAIYIGAAAVKAGLRLDDISSPSHEGLRIRTEGLRLLVAGQNDTATLKAVCLLLESWGCRYFVDDPIGEVFPRTNTVSVVALDLSDQPGFLSRQIWGSGWAGRNSLWKIWNGAGGIPISTGHAWGQYVPRQLFAEHPEYFHERKGKREASDWYCTASPGLRDIFTQRVLAKVRAGQLYPSISPPDGRGYCECAVCQAQDDPTIIEPSSGRVSISTRYADFFNSVARPVHAENPQAILNFYCYADYTQPPRAGLKLEPNLCAWIAPIRYCRFHAIGQPGCESRVQLQEVVDGWARTASKIGYRTYNYNLAEVVVPFSLLSVWQHDIPYLKQKGCLGINLETLANWQIYGPHIYLSIRLAYEPAADAQAIMNDYYLKFYGPQAGPLMKEYWTGIDRAFVGLPSHAGGFAALPLVYTPEFLKRCRGLMDNAAVAARADDRFAARVRMTDEGLRNAEQYAAMREAMNRGEFLQARRVYEALLRRSEASQRGLGNHYTTDYLKRFIGPIVSAGAAATATPRKLLRVLPDEWRMAYDKADAGAQNGFAEAGFDDSGWRSVATYGKPLDAQGLRDRPSVFWYRTAIELKESMRNPALCFLDVDGDATVFINGRPAGASAKKRQPFDVAIADGLRPGRNVIAVRVDHRAMTELSLGGIVGPVLLTAE